MRSLIKICYTIAMLSVVGIAYAGVENPGFTIKSTGIKSFYFDMKDLKSKSVEIRLQDVNDIVFFREIVKNPTRVARKFNLVNLPEGAYFLILEDEIKIWIQKLTIGKNGLIIDFESKKEIFKPVIRLKNEHLDVTMLWLEHAVAKIKIADEVGHALYVESINPSGSLQKRFDVSNLEPGKYTFSVRGKGRTFTKDFVIERAPKN